MSPRNPLIRNPSIIAGFHLPNANTITIRDNFGGTLITRGGDACLLSPAAITEQTIDTMVTEAVSWPLGVRWVSPDQSMWVIEQPPCRRRVTYKANSDHTTYGYDIPVPYVLQIVFVSYLDVTPTAWLYSYMSPLPLASLDDTTYASILPNIHAAGNVCQYLNRSVAGPPIRSVTEVIANFWQQSFAQDFYLHRSLPKSLYTKERKKLWKPTKSIVDAFFYDVDAQFLVPEYFADLEQMSVDDMLALEYRPMSSVRSILAARAGAIINTNPFAFPQRIVNARLAREPALKKPVKRTTKKKATATSITKKKAAKRTLKKSSTIRRSR